MIGYLGMLPFEWEVLSPPEVREALVRRVGVLAERHRTSGGPV